VSDRTNEAPTERSPLARRASAPIARIAVASCEASRSTSIHKGWTGNRPLRRGSEDPCLRREEASVSRSVTSPPGPTTATRRRQRQNRATQPARSVDSTALEAFGPSTPKDRDASSPEEPASPALGSRNQRAPGPVGTATPKGLGAFSSEELSSLRSRIRRAPPAHHQPEGRRYTETRTGDPQLSRFSAARP
jgi:hypothetical protein